MEPMLLLIMQENDIAHRSLLHPVTGHVVMRIKDWEKKFNKEKIRMVVENSLNEEQGRDKNKYKEMTS